MGRAIAIATFVLAFVGSSVDSATAALPCSPVDVSLEGVVYPARVALSRVGCEVGREVVTRYFKLLEEDVQNVIPEAHIDHFRCLSGLAMSQLFSNRDRERIFASIRPEDHPAQWGGPVKPAPGGLVLRPHEAAGYMRDTLSRRLALAFEAGQARKVTCGGRLGEHGRRCRMSWMAGDLAFSGRGLIRLSVSQGRGVRWHFGYRILRFNEYCAVIEGDDCTRVFRAHGTGRAF